MAILTETPARGESLSPSLDANLNRITISLIMLLGAALRLWRLGELGLSYDEAATALMARATPSEIIVFHWTAGFEHPPLWQLLVHGWSLVAGQNEFALRYLPALAGILVIPLSWQFARHLYPQSSSIWHGSALLAAMAPVLIYYSQDARMYAIVLALALGAMIVSTRLVRRPTWAGVLLLALLNVTMTGFHYYAALLFAAQGIYFLIAAMTQPAFRSQWPKWLMALALSALPLMLWMAFSPGFQMTLGSVLSNTDTGSTPLFVFLDELWRDLTVAAIRWTPDWAWIGYLWLPLLAIGLLDALWLRRGNRWSGLSGWYLALLLVVPVLVSALVFGPLSTRYVLYIGPALFILMALGIVRLWNWTRALGLVGMLAFGGVCLVALIFYRTDYAKSEYREMSTALAARIAPDDAVLIESPRQHLPAKYYLDEMFIDEMNGGGNPLYPVPNIELPAHWPVNAPSVVPEEVDGDIQRYLQEHPMLWLSLTAQNEVDPGEFLAKYLTAVAYQVDCERWLDVDLCQYASPAHVEPDLIQSSDGDSALRFDGGLELQGVEIAVLDALPGQEAHLLTELAWLAVERPDADYKVSLRLVEANGDPVAQSDSFPIGPLLPPTTWGPGERKPGYQALAIPADIAPGDYWLMLSLYDPATLESVAYSTGGSPPSTAPFLLANVQIGDTIELASVEVAGQ